MEKRILEVGIEENGEMDFGVSNYFLGMTQEQMTQFRVMTMCAIHAAESMWEREVQQRNPAVRTAPTPLEE